MCSETVDQYCVMGEKAMPYLSKIDIEAIANRIIDQYKLRYITIVMVSHDVEFCARYADVVSMFFDGQILTTDTPRRFFGSNSFYTTAAHRMSRHIFDGAVTAEDVINLYKENKEAAT